MCSVLKVALGLVLAVLGTPPTPPPGTLWWRDGQLTAPPTGPTPRHAVSVPNTSIPYQIFRSHKHSTTALQQLLQAECPVTDPSTAEQRVCRNLQSCAQVNPDAAQQYFDDTGLMYIVEHELLPTLKLEAAQSEYAQIKQAWHRLREHHVLRQVMVLQADFFRLAIVWLRGGWWADADVRCIDSIAQTLNSKQMLTEIREAAARATETCSAGGCNAQPQVGCVLAWEGEVSNPPASTLNWAFGCAARHPLMLTVMARAASLINGWSPHDLVRTPAEFMAAVSSRGKKFHVDVLRLTGPAMFTDAVGILAKQWGLHHTLTQLRQDVAHESKNNKSTWDLATFLPPGNSGAEAVLILPYCFFRSRGCGHLVNKFNDRVIFHHEFETSWRQSYWHNYFDL